MSLTFAQPERRPDLLASLFFRAVAPALAELYEADPPSRRKWGKVAREVSLRAPGGENLCLLFDGEKAHAFREGGKPHLVLRFLTLRQVAKQLEPGGGGTPVPLRGGWRLGLLRRFARLGRRLDEVLNGPPPGDGEVSRLLLRVNLTLGISLRAAVVLAEGEGFSRGHLAKVPAGLAEFVVEGTEIRGWLRKHEGRLEAGKDAPPETPRVKVVFLDPTIAMRALDQQLDLFAALQTGEVRIAGYLPLADALGVILDRVAAYLQPQEK